MDIVKLSTLIDVRNAVYDQAVTYLCKYLTPRQRAEILSPSGATVSAETRSANLALVTDPKFIKGLNAIISQLPDRSEHTLKRMTLIQFKEYIDAIKPKKFTYTPDLGFTFLCVELFHTFKFDDVYVEIGYPSVISFKDTNTDCAISFYAIKYVQLISREAFCIVCGNYYNPKENIKYTVRFE